MPGLNPTNDNPGYLSGRLWAYFGALELAATGDDDIAMSKMPAAIANPKTTVQLVNAHLGPLTTRLARRAPRIADRLGERIAELVDRIAQGTWSPGQTADQSLWVVGYHHQRIEAEIVAGVLIDTAEISRRHFGGKVDAARQQIKRWRDVEVLPDGVEYDGRKWWPAIMLAGLSADRARAGRGSD